MHTHRAGVRDMIVSSNPIGVGLNERRERGSKSGAKWTMRVRPRTEKLGWE